MIPIIPLGNSSLSIYNANDKIRKRIFIARHKKIIPINEFYLIYIIDIDQIGKGKIIDIYI